MSCDWLPSKNRPALADEPAHAAATLAVSGRFDTWHLCDSCALLPRFVRHGYTSKALKPAPPPPRSRLWECTLGHQHDSSEGCPDGATVLVHTTKLPASAWVRIPEMTAALALAVKALEHGLLNVRSLTGGDERRFSEALAACMQALGDR